jgi:hypothetical protein
MGKDWKRGEVSINVEVVFDELVCIVVSDESVCIVVFDESAVSVASDRFDIIIFVASDPFDAIESGPALFNSSISLRTGWMVDRSWEV